jgi:parallel beta-helix repeat protein
LHPEDLVFVEPLRFDPPSITTAPSSASVTVTEFGRSVKTVVIAMTLAPDSLSHAHNAWSDGLANYFTYEYDYGVATPGASSRLWSGDTFVLGDVTVAENGTLVLDDGTYVKIFNEDLAEGGADEDRIEINVEGELIAEGTENDSIVFQSWTPTTTEDWVGFYFDDESDGGTFKHCSISRAEYAIESYADLAVRSTTFEDCRYAGVVAQDGTALIKDCAFSDPGTWGVFLTAADATVRNTIIDSATSSALNVQASATLVARFLNSDKGLYVGGNTTADIDTSCVFNGNAIGIHCYSTGSTPVIKHSTINSNTGNGIFCDNSSHPVIEANTVRYNALGIYCTNSSSPTIKSNMIKSNTYGVSTASGSDPDIGDCCSSGNNTIAYSSQKHVVNWNEYEIGAENNCWNVDTGDCLPPANKIYGAVDTSSPICCTTSSGAGEIVPEPELESPPKTALVAIVPNPFNPSTTVHYSLESRAAVRISVYDVTGRLVRELVNESKMAGAYEVSWKGTDKHGVGVASGVYFVKMSAGSFTSTMKMVLLK